MAGEWPQWPETLPQAFMEDGFSYTPGKLADRSPAGVEPPIARQIRLGAADTLKGSMLMTRDQYDRLLVFWKQTLKGGTYRFTAKLNGDTQSATYSIENEPAWSAKGRLVEVPLEMRRYP